MKKLATVLGVSLALFAPMTFALDTTAILAELATAATDIGAIFGGMVVGIVALWIISKARQLLKA